MAKKTGIFILSSWVSLGFYRGTKHYDNDYIKECIRYEERKNNKYYIVDKPQYLYTVCLGYGLFGILLYVNPITAALVIPKEIYRLEVNIRGLNEEKEKDKYYEFF
jgi:hypothetical protein